MNRLKHLGFVLVLVAFSGTATAYSYSGYTWGHFPITWYLDSSGYPMSISNNQLKDAFQYAFDAWQNAKFDGRCTAVRFKFGGMINSNGTRRDGKNVISFSFSHNYDGSMGKTTIYHGSGNLITEADIVFPIENDINFSVAPKAWQYDLVGIAMHQIGLMLGLSNSKEQDATMYGGKWPSAGDTSWGTLADDDKQAIVMLYPANCPGTVADQGEIDVADTADSDVPTGKCSTDFSNAGSGNFFLPFLLMFMLLISRRKSA